MDLAALVASVGLARRAVRGLATVRADEFSWASLAALLRERGIYVTLSVPVKKIAEQLPVWFLKALLGDFGVGVYGAAQKGYSLVISFFRSLETTVFPLVSEQVAVDTERLRIALRQMQKYSFWTGVVVAVLGGLMAKWLIILIAGTGYLAAVPLFRLWLWRLLIYAFSQSQRPIFFAVGEQKWLFFVYLLSTITEVVFLLAGIHLLGVVGAVWAVLLNSAIFVTVRYLLVHRLVPELWIDPHGIFKVEGFDRRLWRGFKEKSFKFFMGKIKR
jgi:O-antigen/teichoic acid export membrane protein